VKLSGKVAVDTETTGLEWALGRRAFLTIFATDVNHVWLCYDTASDLVKRSLETLETLETYKPAFVFHNAKFDLHMIRASYGWVPRGGYRTFDLHDTMLAFRNLNNLEEAKLKVASKRFFERVDFDVDGPERQVKAWLSAHNVRERINGEWISLGIRIDEDTEHFRHGLIKAGTVVTPESDHDYSLVPRRIMDTYAAGDGILTIGSYEGLAHELQRIDPNGMAQRRAYDRDRHVLTRVVEMEVHGWPVDFDRLTQQREEQRVKLEQGLADLKVVVGEVAGLLKSQKEPQHLNPMSAPQLSTYLYEIRKFPTPPNTTKKGNPTVDEAAIESIPDEPLRDALLRTRHARQAYVKCREFENYAVAERGWWFMHGDYRADRARTGRFSATNPQVHNTATYVEEEDWTHIRGVVRPRPGKSLLFVDFSNLEMRLFALYSQDPVLARVFNDPDGDAHTAVSSMVFGKPEAEVEKTERRFGKTLSFTILYGGGVNRVYGALRYGGAGPALTLEEARRALSAFDARAYTVIDEERVFRLLARHLVDTYYERFPSVRQLNKETSGSIVTRWEKQGFGYVKNLFGRVIGVPKERAHIGTNALIQSTAAEQFKEAILRVSDRLAQLKDEQGWAEDDAELFGNIHDELIFEVTEGLEQTVAQVIEPEMTNDPTIEEYVAMRRQKIPDFHTIPMVADFAIARHASDWGHKEKFPLVRAIV
jgi:DNA polymerase I-like protein with 3'-5' exonuclease and polymerase domains